MANIKSAKKRILQTEKNWFNRFIKSRVRTKIKKIFSLIKSKSKDEAKLNFLSFESDVSKAMSKGF